MTFAAILPAPFGALGVRIEDAALTALEFLPPGARSVVSADPLVASLVARLAAELNAYYADPGHVFQLASIPRGSPFRQRVWRALREIPAGTTQTYGDIARQLGSAPRAVGQAVGDNPLPILIPCHRVIAADGSLGGFMHSRTGYSQDIKRWLLRHEHVI
jgi:methylated-DNA-[protein]-cysteine S-methyltransferase